MPERRAQPCWSGPSTVNTTRPAATAADAAIAPGRSHSGACDPALAILANTANSTAAMHAPVSASIHQDLRVAACAEPVEHRDGPAGVRKPVDRAPRAVAEPPPYQAGDGQCDQQVERQRSEAQPEGPVGGAKRDHGVEQRDRSKAVEHARQHVQHEEDDHQQRDVAMQRVDRKPRPPRPRLESHGAQHAEHDASGQQQQRHRAGAASQIPVGAWARGCRDECAHARSSPSSGQPATWRATPSAVTRRLGQPQRLKPLDGALAADDRSRGGDVRIQARSRGHAHGPPDATRGPARGGIDQVVRERRRRSPTCARSCSRWPVRRTRA